MGALGAVWGLVGVSLILGWAIIRVYAHAGEALAAGLTPLQWGITVAWCLFMLVAEGYRGFQKQFSPRVAARARYLKENPRPIDVIFAPLFCIGYFRATRRRKISSWSLTIGLALLVMVIHQVPQPWRGIIDLGVVLGLAYGLVWIWFYAFLAFSTRGLAVDPQVR